MSSTPVMADTHTAMRTVTRDEASTAPRPVRAEQRGAAPSTAAAEDTKASVLLRQKRLAWAAVWVLLLGLALVAVSTIVWFVPLAVTGVVVGGAGLVLARLGRLMTSPVEYDPRVTPRWAGGPR